MIGEPIRVLHVDDVQEFANLARSLLVEGTVDIEVVTATSVSDGLTHLEQEAIDCVVSDYQMPSTDGLEFLRMVRDQYPDLPFILLTGRGSEEIASEAISAGVTEYMQKGSGTHQFRILRNRIENAVERTRAAARIEETRSRFRTLIHESTDAILIVGRTGTIEYASTATERIIGRSPEDLVGTNGFEAVHPEDRAAVERAFDELVTEPDARRAVEFRYPDQKGSWVWVEARGRNLLDEPSIEGIVVYVRDMSEQKEQEAAIQQERDRFRAVFEQAFDAMVIADDEGRYINVNESACELFGLPREDLIGEHIESFAEDDYDAEEAWISFRESEQVRGTFPLCRPDGEVRLTEFSASSDVIQGEHLSILRDVTERAENRRELERQNERLEKFAGILSHDLQNPLEAARGRLELLAEAVESEHADRLGESLDRMDELITSLLAVARNGQEIDKTSELAFRAVIEDCWNNVDTDGSELTVEGDARIHADESRLQQVVENLLRNATKHGGPDASILVGTTENGFFIEDDRPGIPPADRERVFDLSYTSDSNGTGFGLTIVKEIADGHGWEVAIDESPAGGARLEFSGVQLEPAD